MASAAAQLRIGAAVVLGTAAVAAGCGGGEEASSAPAAESKPVGHESAGSTVVFADCGDWRRGTRAEKLATIRALRGRLTPDTSKTAASPLPDERAFAILEDTCSQGIDSLRLYKLYVRFQGMAPLMTD